MAMRLRSYIAMLLLLIISTVIMPKEFIHAFFDHEDTPHNICDSHTSDVHVEEKHHHCEFLKFQVPPFFVSVSIPQLTSEVTTVEYTALVTRSQPQHSYNLSPLRGPPSFESNLHDHR